MTLLPDLTLLPHLTFLSNCERLQWTICNRRGMQTEDAYSSGYVVLSHLRLCKHSSVETSLSWNGYEFWTSLGISILALALFYLYKIIQKIRNLCRYTFSNDSYTFGRFGMRVNFKTVDRFRGPRLKSKSKTYATVESFLTYSRFLIFKNSIFKLQKLRCTSCVVTNVPYFRFIKCWYSERHIQ